MVEQHRDALNKGKVQLKQILGRALARKERAERELAALEAKKVDISPDIEAGKSSYVPDIITEAESIERELEQQIELKRTEVDQADHAYSEALSELKRLDGSVRAIERESLQVQIDALSSPDPFSPSATDIALENARNAVAELEAQAELDRELAGNKPDSKEMLALSKEQVEARAKKQLQELKAAKRRSEEGEEEPTGDLMPTPRKKTL